ncbi:MAG: putative metal-binding motif-containing protein, partial [Planctomycetota bacterium]
MFVGCSADDPKGGSGEGDGNLRDSGRTIDIEDAGPPDASTDPDATLIMDCEEGETRPCGSDEGECVAGIQVCNQGLWSQICDGEVVPAAERCDGLDNDCDGTPDEALGLGRNCKLEDEFNREVDGLRVCDFATGETVCREVDDCEEDSDGDGFNVCQDCDDEDPRNFPGNDELCDGQDNDCDGFVDPRFDLGEVCYSGQGACRRGGTIVCDEFGVDQVCDALPGQPEGEEICGDEVDNDCDGTLDEGLGLGEACTVGVGACVRDGVRVCAEDRTASECDAEPGVPGDELCGDETDNDCDGRQDEGFDLGSSCTSGRGACAAEGRIVCVEGGRSECDAEAGQPSEELCGDGVDNDCDGQEDEDFDLGTDCVVGVGECARDGRRVCNEDGTGVLCDVIMGEPVAELCGDGVDNDCDGRADEGFAQLGRPCTSGQGQCAREGLFQCSGDRRSAICDAVAGPAAAELCDALDNDCDGTADEGYLLQEPCVSGQGLCRAEGFKVCAGDGRAVTCGAVPLPPQPELCDEEDNDCDGMVDEDFPDIGLPCDSEDDPDLCPYGVWGCDLRTRQLAFF